MQFANYFSNESFIYLTHLKGVGILQRSVLFSAALKSIKPSETQLDWIEVFLDNLYSRMYIWVLSLDLGIFNNCAQ